MLQWTPRALPGLAVFIGGFALAYFIYRSRPAQWVFADARIDAVLGFTSLFVVWPRLWTCADD